MVERFEADDSNMNQEARIYPVRPTFADRSRVRLQDSGVPKWPTRARCIPSPRHR